MSIFRLLPLKTLCLFSLSSLLCASIIGCAVGGDDGDDNSGSTPEGGDAVFSVTATSNERGVATASFALASGTTKFGVTASVQDDDLMLRFTEILSGTGIDYLNPGRTEVSFADSFSRFVKAATVPSRDVDPRVVDTERFTVSVEVIDDDGADVVGEEITFNIFSKADPGFGSGRMRINLFYVGDVGQDQVTKDVVSDALNEFRSIFSSETSINLDIQEIDIDGPVVLPLPIDGNDFYRSASSGTVFPSVNVFIGGDISGGSGSILGISADIPGPFHPSERSGVAVSFFTGAGPDGIYSSEEVRILGETIAHETGHYMGLFHPVDFSGSTVVALDPLDDTDTCSFITECVSNDSLTQNLMFTSPVRDGNGGFVRQNQLTGQQSGVANRYIVTD
jgi:hypothetical protein